MCINWWNHSASQIATFSNNILSTYIRTRPIIYFRKGDKNHKRKSCMSRPNQTMSYDVSMSYWSPELGSLSPRLAAFIKLPCCCWFLHLQIQFSSSLLKGFQENGKDTKSACTMTCSSWIFPVCFRFSHNAHWKGNWSGLKQASFKCKAFNQQ